MKSPATARAAGRAKSRVQDEMVSSTSDDDGNVVAFPKTAEERKALRKARQHVEQQKLVDRFAGEAGDDALFVNADGVAFADLIVNGHRETWSVRSKQFRAAYIKYIKHQAEAATEAEDAVAVGLLPSLKKAAINNAIDHFEMLAVGAGVTREVHVRVAADGDDLFVDLGDPAWHAIRITAMSWSIVQNPPVRFRRSTGMRALPFPESGTSIDKLRPFLNISAHDFVLAVAWVLAALRPTGPYPVLALIGEHGAAKTSLMRLLRSLIDPSTVPTWSIVDQRPRFVHQRAQFARHGVRKYFEVVGSDVGSPLPACDWQRTSHPHDCSRIPTRQCCGPFVRS